MEGQIGFQPQKPGDSFSQRGFQQAGFRQTGFQPEPNKGFQPQGRQEVRVDVVDLEALRNSIEGAKEKIQEAENVLKKLEFTPVSSNDPGFSSNGFSNNGF